MTDDICSSQVDGHAWANGADRLGRFRSVGDMAWLGLVLNIATAALSAVAAHAWWRASKAPLPWLNWGDQPDTGMASAANLGEQEAARWHNEGARIGAKWNKRAAGFACAAAVCQIVSTVINISS